MSARTLGRPRGILRPFTILGWLPRYGLADVRRDVVAGLTVGVVLVPQSMAYAMLAGVPAVHGLYASLVPLLVYPVFGTSRQLAVGTIAIDMLIVAAGLGEMAARGSTAYVDLAILLALMVGAIHVVMGVARAGFLVNLLSRPVIVGFTSGAAVVIALSQLEGLLGVSLPPTQHLLTLVRETVAQFGAVHAPSLALGLAAVLLLVGLRRWRPMFPAALLVVALGMVAVRFMGPEAGGMAVVGRAPAGFPPLELPTVSPGRVRSLLPTALVLALVQFMTVVSLGRTFAARHRYSIRPNRELLAMGAANLAGGLFRAIPVSGSFSRSAVNDQAGARSPLANVVAAAMVAATILWATPALAYLPVPVLSAIIITAALALLDLEQLRWLLRAKRADGAIAVLTLVSTLVIGVVEGILIGIAASVVAVMHRISRPNVAVLGHLAGTRSFRDVRRHEDAWLPRGILVVRVDASFSFANAQYLKDMLLQRLDEDSRIRAVVVDASSINDIDTTAAEVVVQVTETLGRWGIQLCFAGVKEPVKEMMARSGVVDELGEGAFFLSPHRAVEHLLAAWGEAEAYRARIPEGGAGPTP